MTTTRVHLADAVLAGALLVVGIAGTAAVSAKTPAARPADVFAYVLVVLAASALVVRRRWPRATLLLVATLATTYLDMNYPYGPILFSFVVAVYTAARHRPPLQSVPVALIALALMLSHVFVNDAALPGLLGVAPASAWVVVPFAIGISVRTTSEARIRERDEAIRKQVDSERLRVAQEVHDIVGHGLAAIRMQADVALHVLPKRPEQAQVALDAISRTSGEALDELRATLGAVRDDEPENAASAAPRLARLEDLQRRMSDAGARIEVQTLGTPRPLPAAVDLAGYRIVQEALTNVLRHSATRTADVTIEHLPDRVVIVVSNPLPAGVAHRATDRQGHGIEGMRRRVESLGGDFGAGSTTDHRFEVRASIPTDGES